MAEKASSGNPDAICASRHCRHIPELRRAIPQALHGLVTVCGWLRSPMNNHIE